jgi:hypothetical protein
LLLSVENRVLRRIFGPKREEIQRQQQIKITFMKKLRGD